MVYTQQPQKSQIHIGKMFPAAPPIPSSKYQLRRPSLQSSLARPSSKGSITTVASSKSRNGKGSRRPTIGLPTDFRKLEGAMDGAGTLDLGNGDANAVISKPLPALAPPFRPLELQIHMDGRCLSPMPSFSSQPSDRPLPPARSSSLPDTNLSRGPEFAPIPVRSSSEHDTEKELAPLFVEEASKVQLAPMSKLEAEIKDLDEASEFGGELEDYRGVDETAKKEKAVRSQSYYAHAGTLLLASTLDVPPPPVSLKDRIPSSQPASLGACLPQQKHAHSQSGDTCRTEYQKTIHKSQSLGSMPKLSTKTSKAYKTPSLTASPVEMDAKDEYLRSQMQRNAIQYRLSKSGSRSGRSASVRSQAPISPVSPTSDSRSRSNSASKTIATVTESERHSATSLNSIASDTSFSSLNSGNIGNERYVRAKDTEFEMLKPTTTHRLSSRSTNAPVPLSTLRNSPSVPALRAHMRPQLTTSRSTEYLSPSMRVPKPTVKRSRTIQDSPSMSPGLERLGTVGWGQVVKASPRLVTVGEKEPRSPRKVDNKVEWGKGLGAEWGVVY